MAPPRPKTQKGRIDLQEIKKLVELIERSPISDFELVEKDLRIRISKNGSSPASSQAIHAPVAIPMPVSASPVAAPATLTAQAPESSSLKIVDVKSPMVGTFYRAPAPDAEPYVRVGDMVEPGKVLCIVEAMKLMNELECEVKGRIVEILVENAQPVEFGQVLIRVDVGAAQ